MPHPHQEVDITRRLRTIEWLKSELLGGVSLFFKGVVANNGQVITKALASIILTCYFLSRRLGIGLQQVDRVMEEQLRNQLETDHQLEDWYGDISTCLHYFEEKRRR